MIEAPTGRASAIFWSISINAVILLPSSVPMCWKDSANRRGALSPPAHAIAFTALLPLLQSLSMPLRAAWS